MNATPGSAEGLTDLPALDELERAASERLAFFTARRDEAQAEMDKALEYLDRLAGRPNTTAEPRRRPELGERPSKPVSQATLRTILEKVASHGQGCYVTTLQGETGKGQSTVSAALGHAIVDGFVRFESRKAGRRRYWITDRGMEFLTRPAAGAQD